MLGSMIVKAALLSVATGAVSYFITQASILDKPRHWIVAKMPFLRDLVTCAYCLGHWIAVALVLAYRVKLFSLWSPLDYALTIMSVAWVASLLSDILGNAIMPAEGGGE